MAHDLKITPRAAVIDIGSNSVKMTVADVNADGQVVVVLERSEGTRIGEGMDRARELSTAAMNRTMEALRKFHEEAMGLDVKVWRAVATSAVRDASNRRAFESQFLKAFGYALQVLAGHEEAELGFGGATSDSTFTPASGPVLVMDSGGGSSQWILGSAGKIQKRVSLELGCVRMTGQFLRGDPYTESSLKELQDHLEREIAHVRDDFDCKGATAIAIGGSITTVAAILRKNTPPLHGCVLTSEMLKNIFARLARLPLAERLKIEGLPSQRADVIVAGIATFVATMKLFELPRFTVSLRGLRHGVLTQRPLSW